jgi:hypothetical protein
MHPKFQMEIPNGRDHLGDLDLDGWIILKWIVED